MKKIIGFWIVMVSCCSVVFGQVAKPTSSTWSLGADANIYFIPNDFIVLPVFRADKDKLHLEARYNYEDLKTFSGWVGYNISGGKKVEYTITPMLGGVVGNSNGVAPGLEFTFTYNKFELYNESEYLFDVNTNENNFMYSWIDFTYSPKDWLWLGISAQRTRLYETDLDIQRGILVGGGFKQWELNGYLYNVGFGEAFVLLTVSASF